MANGKAFKEQLVDVAKGLGTLKVRTVVGKITAKTPPESAGGMTKVILHWDQGDVKAIATEINLVDGDANTFVPDEFAGEEAPGSIRQFHDRQVQRAQEVVQRNVELMLKVAKELADSLKNLAD